MKDGFVKVVFMGCLLVSCYKEKPQCMGDAGAEKKIESVDKLPYDTLAITTSDTPFQDSADVLQEKWLLSGGDDQLIKLENIALTSDGEASEYMAVTLVSMFRERPYPLILFLDKNRKSGLYDVLTDGLASDLAVYSKEERITEKQRIKEDAIKMSKGKLSKSQMKFVDQLFKDVSPEKFD